MSVPVVRVKAFTVTVATGSTDASPQTDLLTLGGTFVVEWVETRIPPGPRGDVGFYVASSGVPVIPYTTGSDREWFVEDNQLVRWDLDAQPTTDDWSLVSYNTGNYPHDLYLRFGLSLVVPPPPGPVLLLPSASLSGG